MFNTNIKNWKTVTTDENGNPILKYDPFHDEIINTLTGEVMLSGMGDCFITDYFKD